MRYKILDSLLSNRNRFYSITDLLEKVNAVLEQAGMESVSRRCIEKDLVTLECAPYEASIERVWYCGKKCIRYEEDGFSIFTKKLTEDEENLLSEVLNTIGQFDGLDTFEWLDGLKKRLDIKEHRRIIEFDSNPYFSGRNLIGSLFTAISNKQVIALKYHTFKNPQVKEVVVYPYLLKEYKIKIEGKNVVIVGRSNIVGKPLASLFTLENATVTLAHSKTKNLKEITKTADILVSAVGKPNIIKADMVKKKAIVIDVGINKQPSGKVIGDVDFDKIKNIVEYITPVPGGVGPMTIAMLMENTYELF